MERKRERTTPAISFLERHEQLNFVELYSHNPIIMEAAGIEPASEDIQQTASTCLSSSASRSKVFEEEKHCRTSPDEISLIRLRTNLTRYPAGRRFSSTAGKRLRNGMPTC